METTVFKGFTGLKRVRLMNYEKKDILILDFSYSVIEEGAEVIEEAVELLATQPARSLLLLVDMTDADLDSWLTEEFKRFLARNEHRIEKQAVVGINEPQEVAYFTIARFLKDHPVLSGDGQETRKGFPIFNSLEEARDWLVSDQLYLAVSLS